MDNIDPTPYFKCAICGDAFPTNTALINHKAVHEKESRIFVCNCGQSFTDHREYLLHEVTHMFIKETRKCAECRETKSKISFPSHILTHFGESKQTCDVCGIVLSKDKMKLHAKTHSSFNKRFECTVCGKTIRESRRTYHMLCHTKERKSYPCEYCGKIFMNKYEHGFHTNKHLGINTEICEECGYQTHSPKVLYDHKKKHKMSNKFECDYCQETVYDRLQFLSHMKRHTNGYKCRFKNCKFSSSSESELKQHKIKTHYSCKICRKTFSNSSMMNRHKRSYLHKDNMIAT